MSARVTDTRPSTFRGPKTVEISGSGALLTPDALADRWSVPKSQVYRLTREGRLPVVKLGRYYRYALGAVETFEAKGGTGGTTDD